MAAIGRLITIKHPDGVTKTFVESTDIQNVSINWGIAPEVKMRKSPVVNYSPTQRQMGQTSPVTVAGTLVGWAAIEAMKTALKTWNFDTNKYSQIFIDYAAGGPADITHKGMITGGAVNDEEPGASTAAFTFTITTGAADA